MTHNIAKIRAALEHWYQWAGTIDDAETAKKALAALAELEKSAPQFVAGEVTQEMCQRVAASFYGADTFANGVEMHEALQLWRKELGPALGMVELKEPTPEECERISMAYYDDEAIVDRDHRYLGKELFDAVRAVMWPKEGL